MSKERGLDRYLRNPDTILARTIQTISPKSGPEYRTSLAKQVFETAVTIPAAVITTPILATSIAAVAIEDPTHSPFYKALRIDQNGNPIEIVKVRTMQPGKDNPQLALENMNKYAPEDDPRNTKIGKLLRLLELDEIPQLFQVLAGKLSLIDIRCIADYSIDLIQQNRPESFNEWQKAYSKGKPGLIGLNAVMNPDRKNDLKRHHYDILYAKKASLGLDLYILYRSIIYALNKFKRKINKRDS